MPGKRFFKWQSILLLLMFLGLGMLAACSSSATETSSTQGLRTWLLVSAPEKPLPSNRPVNVKSRTEDAQYQISHVELYAVKWPSPTGGVNNGPLLLLRADAAPFDQTIFTASQTFTPTLTGHYVIKVVGYNKLGQWQESDYLGFDVQ